MKLDIGCSPITDRIFIGGVLKSGGWAANKTDVTGAACVSVAVHTLAKGGTITVTANGEPAYEITVKDLKRQATVERQQSRVQKVIRWTLTCGGCGETVEWFAKDFFEAADNQPSEWGYDRVLKRSVCPKCKV